MPDLVCVGVVVGAHGVRGALKVKSFTEDPADVASYGPVEAEDGRRFKARVVGEAKGLVVVTLDGVADRDAAEALKGLRLHVPRSRLPVTEEDEFLVSDLVGLRAEAPDGSDLGTVKGVADFGAGDVVEVAMPGGGSLMVPFTLASVPVVEVAAGRLVVVPPVYAADKEGDEGGKGGDGDE